MKKIVVLLLASSIFSSSVAFAIGGSFSIAVDVQNTSSELSLTETKPMIFPTIIVNHAVPTGSKCYTDSTNNGVSGLCLDSTPNTAERDGGVYSITGTPFANVSLSLSAPVTLNGLKFTPSFSANSALNNGFSTTMSSTGTLSSGVSGFLELVSNQATVVSQSTVFTYDLSNSR